MNLYFKFLTMALFVFFSQAAGADEEKSPPASKSDQSLGNDAPALQGASFEKRENENSLDTDPAALKAGSSAPVSSDSGMEPSSSSLQPFQLRTIHKEIWKPVKSGSFLEGLSDSSNLQAKASINFLQGHVSREQGSGGQMSTFQHVLNPRILRGYTMLVPKSVMPDLFKQIQAQLDSARPKLEAEIQKAKAEMDDQLKHPRLNVEPVPTLKAPLVSIEPSKELNVQIAGTKPMLDAEVELARRKMEEELRRSRLVNRAYPGPISLPENYEISGLDTELRLARAKQQAEAERLKLAMQAELAGRKNVSIPELSVERRKLVDAQKKTAAQLRVAKPEMDAILTSMRLSPDLRIPETDREGSSGSNPDETVIPWDKWYSDFARLYEPRLLKTLAKYGFPEGENTVSISVWKDQRLEATLLSADNSDFDRATLEAYNSLSRNQKLAFPAGSHRTKVSFLIDNRHNNSGPVSTVKSKTFKGDREIQGFKW